MAGKKAVKKSGKSAKKAAQPMTDPAKRRLSVIERVGAQIAKKKGDVEQRRSIVSVKKSELRSAERALDAEVVELDELHDEIANLAVGGFSERFEFPDPTVTTTSPAATVVKAENVTGSGVDKDAWKSLTLAQMGLTNKRAITALTAAGLDTFGKAEERLGDQFAKPIPNFGDAARQAYDDAKIAYFIKNPQPAETKPAAKSTAQKGDPGNASRGAAVEREKKELGTDIDNQLAYFNVPVNEKNALKLLAKIIGTDPAAALEAATLEHLSKWRMSVKGVSEGDVKSAVGAMA